MYDEELLLLMAAPQLCRPWKLFADYFAQNFTRIFKLHCAKSRSSNEDPEHNSVVPFVLVNKLCEYAGQFSKGCDFVTFMRERNKFPLGPANQFWMWWSSEGKSGIYLTWEYSGKIDLGRYLCPPTQEISHCLFISLLFC